MENGEEKSQDFISNQVRSQRFYYTVQNTVALTASMLFDSETK